MTWAQQMQCFWDAALDLEAEPGDAISLLIDAAAFGLNTLDGDPSPFAERLQKSFDELHIQKYLGRPH